MTPVLPGLVFDRESIRVFVPQKAWVVYRLFDAAGVLIYAGASGRPRARLLEHLRDGKPAVTVRIEFFRSSTAMARAEKALAAEGVFCGSLPRRHSAWKAQNRG